MSTAQHRIGNIDIVRGIAAICVMLQHSLEASGIQSLDRSGFGYNWINLGNAGVVAFFLVSGFVIPLSLERSNDLKRFWFSRICRIHPLYIFAVLMGGMIYHTGFSIRSFVAHFLLVQEYVGIQDVVPNSWTLSLELVWYFLFSALFVFGLNHNSRVITALIVGVIACGTVATCVGGPSIPMGRVGLIGTCTFGLFAYRISKGENVRIHAYCLAVIAMSIVIGLYVRFGLFPRESTLALSFRCLVSSWTLGYLLFGISFLNLPMGRLDAPLRLLGTISYSVYLLHPFVLWILEETMLRGWLFVCAVPLLTIPAASATYILIEKPGIQFARLGLRKNQPMVIQDGLSQVRVVEE